MENLKEKKENEKTHSKTEVSFVFWGTLVAMSFLIFLALYFNRWILNPPEILTSSGDLDSIFVIQIVALFLFFAVAIILLTLAWKSVYKK